MGKFKFVQGFIPGLITDSVNNQNGLSTANDVMIIREGEIRKRGGKLLPASQITPDDGITILDQTTHGFNLLSGQFVGLRANDANIGAFNIWVPFVEVSEAFYDVGRHWTEFTTGFYAEIDYNFGNSTTNVDEEIFIAGGRQLYKWRGGKNPESVVDGVTVAAGIVTSTGGAVFPVDPSGMYVSFEQEFGNTYYKIAQGTDTSLTIDSNVTLAVPSKASVISVAPATTGMLGFLFDAAIADYSIFATSCAAHQGRLFVSTQEFDGDSLAKFPSRVRWSALTFEHKFGDLRLSGTNYWEQNASIDVYPGVGGPITGMISTNTELVIFKRHAVFGLRGSVDTLGDDLGASVDVISQHFGCWGTDSFAFTPVGVAFANETGLFTYSGGVITNVTSGRVGHYWRSKFADSPPVVSCIGNRIIVQQTPIVDEYPFDFVDVEALVYDLEFGTFVTQSVPSYGKILRTLNESGSIRGDFSVSYSGEIHDWRGDFQTTNNNDPDSVDRPRLHVTTQAVFIGDVPFSKGRVNNLYLNGLIKGAIVDDPALDVKIAFGSLADAVFTDIDIPYNFLDSDTEKTIRLPVDGSEDNRAVYVDIEQVEEAADVRLYSIGVEYEERNTI